MKAKTIVTSVLLLFVAVSIVALIARELGSGPDASSLTSSGSRTIETQVPEDRLIVYYFHGTARCPTCLTLEEYSKEAVETLFSNELRSGRVEWQVINYDESWNEHFLRDFNLSFQSVVVARMADGTQAEHKNLEKIWELVGDKPAYMEYVRSEIDSFLTKL
jgi:hypothetical protein